MATKSSSNPIDLQKIITSVAALELKALHAGVECMQIWIGQAAKLSNIADDTLQAFRHDKGSLPGITRRFLEFGEQNAEVFGALSSRLTKSYYDELGRLAASAEPKVRKAQRAARVSPKQPRRRKSTPASAVR